jgi:hypothetical protein
VRLLLPTRAGFLQKLGESFQTRSRDVAKLALVKLANRLIETFQESETRGGNAGFDHSAVIGLARAGDEAALLHAVEEAGHVRVVGNHAVANDAAGEAIRFGAPKNAEDVVLRAGEAIGLEELLGLEAEGIGSFLERDEDTVFEGKREMGSGASTHVATIIVMTTNVNRKS